MKLIKLLSGIVLLAFASIFLLPVVITPFNKEKTPEEKINTIIGGLVLGLTTGTGGGMILWSMEKTRREEKQKHIQSNFYRLLSETNGSITTFQLAMTAQISGKEAEQFLNKKAKEFNATFDSTEEGSIIYKFK